MPRMLLLSEIFPPKTGGSGRWFWEVYSRLPPQDALIVTGEDSTAEAFDKSHSLPVLRIPLHMDSWDLRKFRNLRDYARTAWQLARLVRQRRVPALHLARNLPEGFLGYLVHLLTGVPYLMYCHGEDVNVSRTSRELTWMTNRVLSRCRLVIANSRNTERLLLNDWRMPAERVRVVYPGMDAQQFVPAPRDERVRMELGWSERTVLLTVGRLQQRKGHDMLIRALPKIRTAVPNVLYAIIGEGEQAEALRQLAAQESVSEHVQFLGSVSDERMIACYQQCDLFALPNREIAGDIEGFGMVLLEAQACGKPVLAGDSGGTAETMQVPQTGRIVDCTSPEPLAAALIELLSNPTELETVGRRARLWAADNFDWSVVASRAHAAFNEM